MQFRLLIMDYRNWCYADTELSDAFLLTHWQTVFESVLMLVELEGCYLWNNIEAVISLWVIVFFLLFIIFKEMDEEQQKHAEELSQWKKEAKSSQDKVSVLCMQIVSGDVTTGPMFKRRLALTRG